MNDPLSNLPPGKAVIFNGQGKPFEFIIRQIPFIKPGEILVKTLYTTLCGTDIHTYCGRRIEPPHVVLRHDIVADICCIDTPHPDTDCRREPLKAVFRVTSTIFYLT